MNKNILIMCFGKSGGTPAFTIAFAEGMKEAGNNVLCLIAKNVENISDWEELSKRAGIFLIKIDTGNRNTFIKKAVKFLLDKEKILKQIYKIFPDGVDISIQTFTHPWMIFINKWVNPGKEFVIVHDPNPHSGESLINKLMSKFGYTHTKGAIVMTRSFIPVVHKLYSINLNNIFYMRHGKFTNYKQQGNTKIDLGYKANCTNFLFFGRIEKYKGIEILLNAFEKLKEDNKNVTLTIAGKGDIKSEWMSLINQENVYLINRYIKNNEINDLFTGQNLVLVVPYLDATQSGVIPIAIDFGIPIIASSTGGLKEQLDNGKVGVFCEPNNILSLKNAMSNFVQNEKIFNKEKRKIELFSHELGYYSQPISKTKYIYEDMSQLSEICPFIISLSLMVTSYKICDDSSWKIQ